MFFSKSSITYHQVYLVCLQMLLGEMCLSHDSTWLLTTLSATESQE